MSTESDGLIAAFREDIDPVVFWSGALLTVVAIGLIAATPNASGDLLSAANTWLWHNVGWLYIWAMFLSVAFCLWLMIGPWGRIKFGGPDEDPEFSFFELLAMLFSAGLSTAACSTGPSKRSSITRRLRRSSPRKRRLPRSCPGRSSTRCFTGGFRLGQRTSRRNYHRLLRPPEGRANQAVDDLRTVYRRREPRQVWVKPLDIGIVLVSVGGVAVSLGFVVTQFLAGLRYNYGIHAGTRHSDDRLGLTVGFTISAALGVKKGIRRISNFNMYLFAFLLVVAFVFGPTAYLLDVGTQAFGGYVNHFIAMSLYMNASHDVKWVGGGRSSTGHGGSPSRR